MVLRSFHTPSRYDFRSNVIRPYLQVCRIQVISAHLLLGFYPLYLLNNWNYELSSNQNIRIYHECECWIEKIVPMITAKDKISGILIGCSRNGNVIYLNFVRFDKGSCHAIYFYYLKTEMAHRGSNPCLLCKLSSPDMGAQWLSGRVLDSRQRDLGFEPHQHHCVVSFSKTLILAQYWFNPGRPVPT